jgi:hypothetical protein
LLSTAAEHDGSTGAVIREYVWLDDIPLAVIEASVTPTISYIHADHQTALTDATGPWSTRRPRSRSAAST